MAERLDSDSVAHYLYYFFEDPYGEAVWPSGVQINEDYINAG